MPGAEGNAPGISVCVCTFRRPRRLQALLDALARLQSPGRVHEVVVVDNDAEASAGAIVASAAGHHPHLHLRYAVEPEQNISLARNRSVREATAPWVAFIDDDEEPEPGWLRELALAQRRWDADGVFGPVLPRLPPGTPTWVMRGGFHSRPRHADGASVPEVELRTGNALLRRSLLAGEPQPFDPAFGRSGGEDTALLARLARRGARFVWCDRAVVWEHLSAERTRLSWLLARSLRSGQTWTATRPPAARGPVGTTLVALRAAAVLGGATVLALPTVIAGRHHAVRWLLRAARNLGKLTALTGMRLQLYRR